MIPGGSRALLNRGQYMDEFTKQLYEKFPGRLMTDYVWWILQEAEKSGIKVLYFLARDGWLLREIALVICERYNLDIECRYLYCSRISLRTPSYWLIGEEAFDLLLCGGYQLRLDSILQRARLNEAERQDVYKSCGWTIEDERRLLSWAEFDDAAKTLRSDPTYRRYVIEKSKAAYPAALGYLRQEGLVDQGHIAIVDSGWTGSMQRSLRQLLESAGWRGKLTGFYFGMFKAPKEAADGDYRTWYFSWNRGTRAKACFNNNLFECLLEAPHGMTVEYRQEGKAFVPVLLDAPADGKAARICEYKDCVLAFTAREVQKSDFRRTIDWRITDALIRRYMCRPTKREVELLGAEVFCDDITELYQSPLADKTNIEQLKQYTIAGRLKVRFFSKTGDSADAGMYWPYGTAAFVSGIKRGWYRGNIFLWQYAKYKVNHF